MITQPVAGFDKPLCRLPNNRKVGLWPIALDPLDPQQKPHQATPEGPEEIGPQWLGSHTLALSTADSFLSGGSAGLGIPTKLSGQGCPAHSWSTPSTDDQKLSIGADPEMLVS